MVRRQKKQERWYMGRDVELRSFSTERVGQGNDQLGPGLYFGSTSKIAGAYGSKIHVVEIAWKKKLKPFAPVDRELLRFLLDNVPDWETENDEVWGERSAAAAKRKVFDLFTNGFNNVQMISQLPGTVMFYRDDPQALVDAIAAFGYTGFAVPAGSVHYGAVESDDQHAIIYDPAAIKLVEVLDREARENPLVLSDYRSYCEEIADLYDALPEHNANEEWRWRLLIDSVENFWRKMLRSVDVEFVPGQPYDNAEQMKAEVARTGVLYVSTEASGHPLWTDEQNLRFRAVHDYVVHILGDSDFSRRGEIRAYNLHRRLTPKDAWPALFTEVTGQACFANARGEFPVQKIAVFDDNDVDLYNVGVVKGQKVTRQPRGPDREMVPPVREARVNPDVDMMKISFRVKEIPTPGSRIIVARAYAGRTKIGHVQAWSPGWKPVSLLESCSDDVEKLQAGGYEAKDAWLVGASFLEDEYHGIGAGKELYRALITGILEIEGGKPFYIGPHACAAAGSTSREASRVWRSLAKDYPSSGSILFAGSTTRQNPLRSSTAMLKQILTMSDADKGRDAAVNFVDIFEEWIEEKGLTEDDFYNDDVMAKDFFFDSQEEAGRRANEDSYGPPYYFMDFIKVVRDEWLVHFTDDAEAIAQKGFIYGVADYNQLGLSTHWGDRAKTGGGWNFAYRLTDFVKHGRERGYGGGWKYGKEAVLFRANGILVDHWGDEEPQVIFDGATARDLVALEKHDEDWSILSEKTRETLYSNESLEKVANWIKNNFEQYRKQLRRKRPKSRQNPLEVFPTFEGQPAWGGTEGGVHTADTIEAAAPYAQLKGRPPRDYPVVLVLDMRGRTDFKTDIDVNRAAETAKDYTRGENVDDFLGSQDDWDLTLSGDHTWGSTQSWLFERTVPSNDAVMLTRYADFLEGAGIRLPTDPSDAADQEDLFRRTQEGTLTDEEKIEIWGQRRYMGPVDEVVGVYYLPPFGSAIFEDPMNAEDPEEAEREIARVVGLGWEVVTDSEVEDYDVAAGKTLVWGEDVLYDAQYHGTSYRNVIKAFPWMRDQLPKPPRPFMTTADLREEVLEVAMVVHEDQYTEAEISAVLENMDWDELMVRLDQYMELDQYTEWEKMKREEEAA